MAHIKHYCYNDGRIILDFNKIKLWFTHHKELAVSEWNPNRFDHVGQSVKFLQDFTSNNEGKFDNLKTHKKYKWSEKESTEEGSPLSDIVRQGNKDNLTLEQGQISEILIQDFVLSGVKLSFTQF